MPTAGGNAAGEAEWNSWNWTSIMERQVRSKWTREGDTIPEVVKPLRQTWTFVLLHVHKPQEKFISRISPQKHLKTKIQGHPSTHPSLLAFILIGLLSQLPVGERWTTSTRGLTMEMILISTSCVFLIWWHIKSVTCFTTLVRNTVKWLRSPPAVPMLV